MSLFKSLSILILASISMSCGINEENSSKPVRTQAPTGSQSHFDRFEAWDEFSESLSGNYQFRYRHTGAHPEAGIEYFVDVEDHFITNNSDADSTLTMDSLFEGVLELEDANNCSLTVDYSNSNPIIKSISAVCDGEAFGVEVFDFKK